MRCGLAPHRSARARNSQPASAATPAEASVISHGGPINNRTSTSGMIRAAVRTRFMPRLRIHRRGGVSTTRLTAAYKNRSDQDPKCGGYAFLSQSYRSQCRNASDPPRWANASFMRKRICSAIHFILAAESCSGGGVFSLFKGLVPPHGPHRQDAAAILCLNMNKTRAVKTKVLNRRRFGCWSRHA